MTQLGRLYNKAKEMQVPFVEAVISRKNWLKKAMLIEKTKFELFQSDFLKPDIPEIEKVFIEEMAKEHINKFNKYKNEYVALNKVNYMKEYEDKSIDIEKVKQVPISEIIPANPITKTGSKWLYSSPLKREIEDTPSFWYYLESNTYYDFSLGEYGDVINLYMQIEHKDFVTAIKELNNYV